MAGPAADVSGNRPVVVVVGSVNADLVVRLPRLPGPGETVLDGTFHRGGGGKGANQAAAAARLGARAILVGRVGDDDLGRGARAELDALGVDASFLAVGAEPTGVALILVDAAGENLIGVASGANRESRVVRRWSWPAWRFPTRPSSRLPGRPANAGSSSP
jgi:ribokinase